MTEGDSADVVWLDRGRRTTLLITCSDQMKVIVKLQEDIIGITLHI